MGVDSGHALDGSVLIGEFGAGTETWNSNEVPLTPDIHASM